MSKLLITVDNPVTAPHRAYYSTDGTNWSDVDVDMQTMSLGALDFSRAILTGRNSAFTASQIKYSHDAGATWNVAGGDWAASAVHSVYNLSKTGGLTAVALGYSNLAGGKYYVLKTIDGGATFNVVAEITTITPTAMAFSPTDPNEGVAFTTTHFWKTTDGGVSWSQQEAFIGAVTFLKLYNNNGKKSFVANGVTYYREATHTSSFSFDALPTQTRSIHRLVNLVHVVTGAGGGNNVFRSTDDYQSNANTGRTGTNGVVFIDSNEGYYTTGTEIFQTLDGAGSDSSVYTKPAGGGDFNGGGNENFFDAGGDIPGCMEPTSCNYNPLANVDDASCDYRYRLVDCDDVETSIITDTDLSSEVGNTIKINEGTPDVCWTVNHYTTDCVAGTGVSVTVSESNADCTECQAIPAVPGCTDPNSCNYNPLATEDNGSCEYRYDLTTCETNPQIQQYTETDLSAYVGGTVKIAGVCWNVARHLGDCADGERVYVTVDGNYPNCELCELSEAFTTYSSCEECNALCYKLIDCDGVGNHPTVSTNNSDFASYIGKTIKWIDEADAPDYVERCATVDSFKCRLESYPTPVITIVDCYDTCAECKHVEPEIVPELKTGRSVSPGYDVPDCVTPSTSSCE